MAALSGLKVLDLSRILAGPWTGQVLSDLGAQVIKVERPVVGDDTRHWKPPVLKDKDGNDTNESAYYLCANRGKRSICINLKDEAGQRIVKELAAQADILIENYKVGQLKKFGLDYESLAKVNPRLIYASITGFGQTGPYAPRAGYDYVIQGMSGLMSVTGERDDLPGGGPMRTGVAVADLFTGSYTVIGILAALEQRHRTGRGQHVDLALLDTMVALLANQNMNALIGGYAPQRLGAGNPNVVPYQVFYAADKPFVLAVGNDAQFKKFCAIADCMALTQDPRFATNEARVKNRAQIVEIVAQIIKTRTAAEWFDVLEAAGVPAGPINTIPEALANEQVVARGMRINLPHPLGVELPMVGTPIHLSDSEPQYHRAPPMMGEHTDEVMHELGYDDETIAALKLSGSIG